MPQPPVGLEDLGPAAGLRVVGPDREKWLQGMQSNDLAAAPHGGALPGAFLSGRGGWWRWGFSGGGTTRCS